VRLTALVGVVLAGAAALPAAAQRDPLLAQRLRIGLLAPITGAAAPSGQEMLRGATLAVEQINAQGGVTVRDRGGRMLLELVIADDQTSPEQGVQAATRLVTGDPVDVVTGGATSAVTLAAQEVIAQYKTPFLIAGAATPRVTRRMDIDTQWMFHYQEIAPLHGKAMAAFLAEVVQPQVAAKRPLGVALILQDSAFGEDFRLGLPGLGIVGWTQAQNLPLAFVAVEKYPPGEIDFRPLLARVAAAKPDVIIPLGFQTEVIALLTQGIRELGLRALWGPTPIGTDAPGYYQAVRELADLSTIETYFSTYETPQGSTGAALAAFRMAYRNRWGEPPGLFAATLFDSIFILKRAVEEAGSLEKARVREALAKLDIPGLTLPVQGGRIRFDENREVRFSIFVTQLLFDPALGETRPRIVWPPEMATAAFRFPR
jgi:branched-chain amino acid transport system substrate-binding protein